MKRKRGRRRREERQDHVKTFHNRGRESMREIESYRNALSSYNYAMSWFGFVLDFHLLAFKCVRIFII